MGSCVNNSQNNIILNAKCPYKINLCAPQHTKTKVQVHNKKNRIHAYIIGNNMISVKCPYI